VQAGVGSAGVRGTKGVELFDGTISVDYDERAGHQPQPLDRARLAEHKLDEFTEETDLRFLMWRGVPPVKDADQPLGIARSGRPGTPVGVWQQQVDRRRAELKECLVGCDRVIVGIDRGQQAAVAVAEFWRLQKMQAIGNRAVAVGAVGVAAMPVRRFGIAIQANADADAEALERFKHRPAEQGPVGLHGHVHLSGHSLAERSDEFPQPVRCREKRLTAVQDDVDAVEVVALGVVGDALDSLGGYRIAHAHRHAPPRLVRHFVHVAVRARQVAATMHLQDELPERDWPVARFPDGCHIEVEQRPGRGMARDLV
jgi:hypothetical protein